MAYQTAEEHTAAEAALNASGAELKLFLSAETARYASWRLLDDENRYAGEIWIDKALGGGYRWLVRHGAFEQHTSARSSADSSDLQTAFARAHGYYTAHKNDTA